MVSLTKSFTMKTKDIVAIMNVLFWIVFIGLCIEVGFVLVSFALSLFIDPNAPGKFYQALKLGDLMEYSMSDYFFLMITIITIGLLKAYIAYLVVKISMKLNLLKPFSEAVAELLSKISALTLTLGISTIVANFYCEWLQKREIALPDVDKYVGDSSEIVFFAGVIFIIAQVFKKGLELQSDNELTI